MPEMNQRSSARTARRKTRLVVRRGRIGVYGSSDVVEGLEREKRICGGAKIERVPVPVRSGRCSPSARMWRIRFRYWCSSWVGSWGMGWGVVVVVVGWGVDSWVGRVSAEGAILYSSLWWFLLDVLCVVVS